jgi:hypothetical protein
MLNQVNEHRGARGMADYCGALSDWVVISPPFRTPLAVQAVFSSARKAENYELASETFVMYRRSFTNCSKVRSISSNSFRENLEIS